VADLRVRVLGGFEIDGVDATGLGSRKGRTVLKMLALGRGTAVSVDAIAEGLWGDAPPAKPADQVSVLVSRLRSAIGPERITRDDAGYRLHLDWLDLDALEELTVEAERRLAGGQPASAGTTAAAAVSLARGPLLPDEPDAPWAEQDRARAARLAARAAHAGAEAALTAGDPTVAADLADRALADDPFDEAALRLLMRAHVGAGRPASALAAYARMRERLAGDLGVDPAPETEALHTEILLVPEPQHVTPVVVQEVPGRSAALRRLDGVLGRGGLLVVTGEAGIGKTTLLDGWTRNIGATGAVVLRGRCEELARGLPMQAVMDALAGHLAFLEPEQCDAVLGPEATVLAPMLGRLQSGESRVGEAADQAAGEALVFGAVLTVLGRVASERRVALVLEDVHLAGSLTVEWLHFVARRGTPPKVVIVVSRRPEEGLPLPGAEALELGPLDMAAAALVVGGDRAAELHARSGGHPLFLVELASAPPGELPASIREAVASRCDRAGAAAASLRAAAVLGADVDLDLLAAVVRAPPLDVLAHLEEGERRGLLVERAGGFEFAHALVREALAAGTSTARRGLLHREAGRVLATRPNADALAVAHHARLGGDREVAARALLDAARVASARYDQVEAKRLLDESIDLVDGMDARLARGRVRLLLTDYGGARDDALVAERADGGAPALELAAWASHYLREFAAAATYADAGAAATDDPLVRSGCLAIGGWTRMSLGSLRDAEPVLVAASEVAGVRPHAMAPVGLGGLRLFQGRLDEAVQILTTTTASSDDPQPSVTQAYAYMMRGMALGHAGRPVEAMAQFIAMEQDVTLCNLEHFLARADNFIAWVLRGVGDSSQALERNELAREIAAARGLAEPWCHALADLAAAHVLEGDPDGAAALLDEHDVRTLANHSLPWRHITRARVLRGRVALLRDDPDEAETTGAAVIAEARALDMARYASLGQVLVVQARLTRGESTDHDEVGELLERLSAQAGLDAWRLTADVARLAGVDGWRALAERQLAALATHAGPYRSSLETAAARVLAR
jgi:DNA-binding SARP family transcriptional activator